MGDLVCSDENIEPFNGVYERSPTKEDLESYFSNGYLSDLNIICGRTIYKVHKLVLGAACPLLWNIFVVNQNVDLVNLSEFGENQVKSFIYKLYELEDSHDYDFSSILKTLQISQGLLLSHTTVSDEGYIIKTEVSPPANKENINQSTNNVEINRKNNSSKNKSKSGIKSRAYIIKKTKSKKYIRNKSDLSLEKIRAYITKRVRSENKITSNRDLGVETRAYIKRQVKYKSKNNGDLGVKRRTCIAKKDKLQFDATIETDSGVESRNYVIKQEQPENSVEDPNCALDDDRLVPIAYQENTKNEVTNNCETDSKRRVYITKEGKQKVYKYNYKKSAGVWTKICTICSIFSSESSFELRKHKESEHNIISPKIKPENYNCKLCGKYIGGEKKIRKHMKYDCPKCQIPCTYCTEKFKNKRAADSHITREHDPLNAKKYHTTDQIICNICGQSVPSRKFDYHQACHDSNADLSKFEKWECFECGKKFISKSVWKSHTCKHNAYLFEDNDGNLTCTLCANQLKSKPNFMKHLKEHHPEHTQFVPFKGSYSCPFPGCQLENDKLNKIKSHLETVHYRVKKISCDICREKFENTMKKKLHIRKVHTGKGEFQCDQCEKDFVTNGKLKNHFYINHSQEKHFICNYCNKAFKQKSELQRHLFVHEAHLSKFQCNVCAKKFRDKSTLNVHIKSHA